MPTSSHAGPPCRRPSRHANQDVGLFGHHAALSVPPRADVATLVAMRRALPFLAAAAIGASLVLSFLELRVQFIEAREEQRQAAIDGVTGTHVDFFAVPGPLVFVLSLAALLSALVTPRRWHWIAGMVLFGAAVVTVAMASFHVEVHVLSYAAWGAAAVGGLLMVVTSVIEKKA